MPPITQGERGQSIPITYVKVGRGRGGCRGCGWGLGRGRGLGRGQDHQDRLDD